MPIIESWCVAENDYLMPERVQSESYPECESFVDI